MDSLKKICIWIILMVFTTILTAPALAHRKYRAFHKGPPKRVLVQHSHAPGEPAESETKEFYLLDGAAWIIKGTFKTLDNVIKGVFGGEEEPES